MLRFLPLPLLSVILVSGLTFPPVGAYTSVYVTFVGMVMALVAFSPRYWEAYSELPFRLLWLSAALLGVAAAFVFHGIEDLFAFAALAPVFIAPGMTMLLLEEQQFARPQFIAMICLTGVIAAVVVALNDVLILNMLRAGGGNNPIHFGGLSVMIGFMALIGLFGPGSRWRYVFVFGPILGTTAAVLSGSRGPVLAAMILSVVVLPFLVVWLWHDRFFRLLLAIAVVGLAAALLLLDTSYLGRSVTTVGDIAGLLDPETIPDPATAERLVFYNAAWQAFLEAPLFGHGSGHLGTAVTPHIPEGYGHMVNPAHLHNDIADFAVIGGLVGIAAYVCLLLSPFFSYRVATSREIRRCVLLGAVILSVGYAVLGITNAMFGVLPQTMLFGLLLGVLVGMAKVPPNDAETWDGHSG